MDRREYLYFPFCGEQPRPTRPTNTHHLDEHACKPKPPVLNKALGVLIQARARPKYKENGSNWPSLHPNETMNQEPVTASCSDCLTGTCRSSENGRPMKFQTMDAYARGRRRAAMMRYAAPFHVLLGCSFLIYLQGAHVPSLLDSLATFGAPSCFFLGSE